MHSHQHHLKSNGHLKGASELQRIVQRHIRRALGGSRRQGTYHGDERRHQGRGGEIRD
jgi:hypothetical protein